MEIQALKIFNSKNLILFLILVLGVITVLIACGDLVEESETGAWNRITTNTNTSTLPQADLCRLVHGLIS